ncbi:MAG TPA: hypothetical protein VGC44_04405 [Longimicrobiales bacterium]
MRSLLFIVLLATFTTRAEAQTPPRHFIFFALERERITDSAFTSHPNIAGAQLKYSWRELEPVRDAYDFRDIERDLATLAKHGKRLWIQLQDVSFSSRQVVPDYLLTDTAFHGGVAREYEGERFTGLTARRWDPAVRDRFAKLLQALGRQFDGRIEGINLAETAVGLHDVKVPPSGYTAASYAHGVRAMMSAAKAAFPKSHVVVYANFMPGDTSDSAYLRQVYAHAERSGVGVGGPDILPLRPWQRKHSLPLIAARAPHVIGAMAVQDGNLAERITVAELMAYATATLRLNYIFWGTEEPYYTRDVLPFLR